MAARAVFLAAVSRAVLALWHGPDSHARFPGVWSSPGVMWSASVPCPSQSGSCVVASHLPCALARTCARVACQLGGRRCRRSEVAHATAHLISLGSVECV